jgi:hypothetical protein
MEVRSRDGTLLGLCDELTGYNGDFVRVLRRPRQSVAEYLSDTVEASFFDVQIIRMGWALNGEPPTKWFVAVMQNPDDAQHLPGFRPI